jgi:hypothetical protein
MCGKPAKWQINRPMKPSVTACNEHLGGMIEGQMPKEPGQSFSFQLLYVASIQGFSASCLHVEASIKTELETKAGTEKVIRGPELTPSLGAQPSVEVK